MTGSKKKESQVSDTNDTLKSEEEIPTWEAKIMTIVVTLNVVGLLPPPKSSSFIKLIYKTFRVFIHIVYALTAIAEFTAFVVYWGNLPVVATTMAAMSGLLLSMTSSINFLRNRKKFISLIDMLRTEFVAKLKPKYMKLIFKAERDILLFSLFLYPVGLSISFTWILAPFLNKNPLYNFKNENNVTEGSSVENLIFVMWFPFEFDKSPQFEIVIALQVFVMTFAVIMVFALDLVFLSLMRHAAALLRVLRAMLNDMHENVTENNLHTTRYVDSLNSDTDVRFQKNGPVSLNYSPFTHSLSGDTERNSKLLVEMERLENEHLEEDIFRQYLVECIRYHQAVYAFVDQLNEVVSAVTFLKLLNFPLVICMTAFQMTQSIDSQQQLLRFLSMFAGGVSLVTSYTWFGQQVINESEEVATAFYNLDWYNQTPEFKRLLPLAIMRASKPAKVEAGVFFDMSFVTLAAIMNTSYKIFMMLIQLQDA